MEVAEVADKSASTEKKGWNYSSLTCALIVGLLAQCVFLPCLCAEGTAKINFAIVFDVLIVLRIILAKILKQRDKGWIFYLIMIYTSPLWIELAAWIVFTH
tara:strand:+ start:789 stop:1091 length:303 start_codon:yes stop_codon:yes gene_type:complete